MYMFRDLVSYNDEYAGRIPGDKRKVCQPKAGNLKKIYIRC